MDSKEKYFIYKKKYIALKKSFIKQTGGAIQDIYKYLEQNIGKIKPLHFEILQEYADTLLTSNPQITLSEFISNVNSIYGITLTPIQQKPAMPSRSAHGLFSGNLFRPNPALQQNIRKPLAQHQPRMAASAIRDEGLFTDLLGSDTTPDVDMDVDLREPSEPSEPSEQMGTRQRGVNRFREFEDFLGREFGAVAETVPLPDVDVRVELEDRNLITVYTTGLAYIENDNRTEYIRALIENIIETCTRAGKRVRFIHYDRFYNLTPRYYRDEIFINGYLTPQIIQAELENNPNALLVDIAHIIHYYKPMSGHQHKPLMNFYSYEESRPSFYNPERRLNINSFYPGFIGDMETINYIRLFKFFQFENNNIVTFIEKGIERNIEKREIYKGDTTTFLDFTIHVIDISGLIANISSPQELNILFWE